MSRPLTDDVTQRFPYRVSQRETVSTRTMPRLVELAKDMTADPSMRAEDAKQRAPLLSDRYVKDSRGHIYRYRSDGSVVRVKMSPEGQILPS